MEYFRPESPEEAVEILRRYPGGVPLAGGTDLVVAMRRGKASPTVLVDLASAGMDEVDLLEDVVRLGSRVTMSRLAGLGGSVPELRLAALAAEQVGAWQIQNRATVGGNLCNASPAADVACALLALDARVIVLGGEGQRSLALQDFFLGPGRTALAPGEILLSVEVPRHPSGDRGHILVETYRKVGSRNAMVIAVASLAARTVLDGDGRVVMARYALGSVAPTVFRARATEELLEGKPLDEAVVREAVESVRREVSPIDDQRATAAYRTDVVGALVADHLAEVASQAGLEWGR